MTKFYIGGIVNVGIDWIKNKNKYTKEELLLYFDKLIPDKV
ncbi:MAG: TetR-like C-terminal domain-containing protein [Candidatus Coprovivens sp.]